MLSREQQLRLQHLRRCHHQHQLLLQLLLLAVVKSTLSSDAPPSPGSANDIPIIGPSAAVVSIEAGRGKRLRSLPSAHPAALLPRAVSGIWTAVPERSQVLFSHALCVSPPHTRSNFACPHFFTVCAALEL
jgi:hypothetical protein